ncbi:MAG: O-linked N-acetylglucosamine transferase, SPINDLY family protein [Leptolyngbyaceae cyanobacterium SL_7_1]|nr:O-linked N-acetylglucosamine transferase, SPINDLY family protein [Leptolyngbyaceae cyanobacterium SL_7_1]
MSGLISASIADLHARAADHYAHQNYEQAAAIYEQLLLADPMAISYSWQLGLMRLLQGHEAEAQLTWALATAELDPDRFDQSMAELVCLLETTAEHYVQRADPQTAWLIRQHLREIDPENFNNLLHLLQLSLSLERSPVETLVELDVTKRLQTAPSSVDPDLLWQVGRSLLETYPHHPPIAAWVEASLPYITTPPKWVGVMLLAMVKVSRIYDNPRLAHHYAELCYRLDPHNSEVILRLSILHQEVFQFDQGIDFAKQYLAGAQTPLHQVMGTAILLRGLMVTGARWQEATAVLQQQTEALETFLATYQPESGTFLDASVICMPMFFYPYLRDDPAATRSLQNRLSNQYQSSLYDAIEGNASGYQPYPLAAPVSRSRSTLRVGYISRCMRMHSVGWLSRWVFQHFDRDRFEVYAYFNQKTEVEPFSQQWFADKATRACCFDGDILGVAEAIRQDEIDILVDLDSITSDHTCGVMALKPAPIQVTWLGLDATGLPAIDYFLADPYVLPDEAETYYNEAIWRLPQTYIAVDGFEVGVPSLRRDRLEIPSDAVIYFSVQVGFKRHPANIRSQLQIIHAVPHSYLLIKGLGDDKAMRGLFEQLAEEKGVERDRLRFLSRDASELVHRANLGIADVVLDTYPYNGATTTLETLWMGIPLVTQVGHQFASRNSYTMMRNAGITAGIAYTPEEYVEWGIRLGQDSALRETIRMQLWRSRQTSPLWNGRQFTRDLETAYEQMWLRYEAT